MASRTRPRLRATVAFLFVAALGCGGSPTGPNPRDLAELRGTWEVRVREKRWCHTNAIARTLVLRLDTVTFEGVQRLHGGWTNHATGHFAYALGEYTAATGRLSLEMYSPQHSHGVDLWGSLDGPDRFVGQLRRDEFRLPFWNVGDCEQRFTARRLSDDPWPDEPLGESARGGLT